MDLRRGFIIGIIVVLALGAGIFTWTKVRGSTSAPAAPPASSGAPSGTPTPAAVSSFGHVLGLKHGKDYYVVSTGEKMGPFRRGFAVVDPAELNRLLYNVRGPDGRNLSERVLMGLPISANDKDRILGCLHFAPGFNELEFTLRKDSSDDPGTAPSPVATSVPGSPAGAGLIPRATVKIIDLASTWDHFVYSHRIDIWKRVRFLAVTKRVDSGGVMSSCPDVKDYMVGHDNNGCYWGSIYNFIPWPGSVSVVPVGLPVTAHEIDPVLAGSYIRGEEVVVLHENKLALLKLAWERLKAGTFDEAKAAFTAYDTTPAAGAEKHVKKPSYDLILQAFGLLKDSRTTEAKALADLAVLP